MPCFFIALADEGLCPPPRSSNLFDFIPIFSGNCMSDTYFPPNGLLLGSSFYDLDWIVPRVVVLASQPFLLRENRNLPPQRNSHTCSSRPSLVFCYSRGPFPPNFGFGFVWCFDLSGKCFQFCPVVLSFRFYPLLFFFRKLWVGIPLPCLRSWVLSFSPLKPMNSTLSFPPFVVGFSSNYCFFTLPPPPPRIRGLPSRRVHRPLVRRSPSRSILRKGSRHSDCHFPFRGHHLPAVRHSQTPQFFGESS